MVFSQGSIDASSRSERNSDDYENEIRVEAQTSNPFTTPLPFEFTDEFSSTSPQVIDPNLFAQSVRSSSLIQVLKVLTDTYQQIPLAIKMLFMIEVVVLTIAIIVYGVVAASWANTALMSGVLAATQDRLKNLASIVRTSFTHLKAMVWLSVVPTLVLVLLLIVSLLLLAYTFSVAANNAPLLSIPLVIGYIILAVYVLLRFFAALTWGARFIVNDGVAGKEAFKLGNKVGHQTYWKVLRLGTVNLIVTFIIASIIFIPAFALGIKEIRANSFEPLNLWPAAVLFIAALPISSLVSSILNVFTFATWQFGFETVRSIATEEA